MKESEVTEMCSRKMRILMSRAQKRCGIPYSGLQLFAEDGDGGGAVDAVELADDEQVGHAVQGLQKVGQQIGQGKIQNILKYAPGGQVSLHGGLLLWTVEKPTTVKIVGFRRGLAYSS